MSMFQPNYLAVLVAAVANMAVGAVWYSPPVFGKLWMRLAGKTESDVKKGSMAQSYLIAFASAIVMSYVLAHFVNYAGANGLTGGMQVGFWMWFGFVATVSVGNQLWEGKPWRLYFLNNAYQLLNLLVMGAILAVWN